MTAIPFVYFSLIAYYLYRKHKRVDIAVIIAMMFAVSGFFSILIDVFDLRYADSVNYQISPNAAIVYCGMLTLCLMPFSVNSHLSIHKIRSLRRGYLLKTLAWIAIIWFLFTAFFSWKNMMNVLTGDMSDYRQMVYLGEGQVSWMLSLPAPIRFIVAVFNFVFGCKWSLMFLAFLSCYVQKLPRWYFYMYLIASLSGPMQGVIGADRSAAAYWMMSFFAMYLFFQPIMSKQDKRQLYVIAMVLIGVLSVYLAAMTIARFGEKDYGNEISGSQGGVISYLGQSYINFCLFYDNYNPPFPHYGIIFPFIYQYILGIPSGGVPIQELMTNLTGFRTGVFYTFIGQILMGAGKPAAIVYCFLFFLISFGVTSRICQRNVVSADKLYLYFALASVVYLGIFVHYYASGATTFGLIVVFILLKMMK